MNRGSEQWLFRTYSLTKLDLIMLLMQQSFFHSSSVDNIPFINLGIHCPHWIQCYKWNCTQKKRKRKNHNRTETHTRWCLTKVWGFLIFFFLTGYWVREKEMWFQVLYKNKTKVYLCFIVILWLQKFSRVCATGLFSGIF